METKMSRKDGWRRRFGRRLGVMALAAAAAPVAVADTVATTPLFVSTGVPSNLILDLDVTAGMKQETLIAGPYSGGVYVKNDLYNYVFQSGYHQLNVAWPTPDFAVVRYPRTNRIYFDPEVVYQPWTAYGDKSKNLPDYRTHDDCQDPVAAGCFARWHPILDNPNDAVKQYPSDPKTKHFPNYFDLTRDLQVDPKTATSNWNFRTSASSDSFVLPKGTCYKKSTFTGAADHCGDPDAKGWKEVTADTGLAIPANTKYSVKYFPAAFYWPKGGSRPKGYSSFDLTKAIDDGAVDVASPTTEIPGKRLVRFEIRPENFGNTDEYKAAIRNFANWFTYHRGLHLGIMDGFGAAFKDFSKLRVAAVAPLCTATGEDKKDNTLPCEVKAPKASELPPDPVDIVTEKADVTMVDFSDTAQKNTLVDTLYGMPFEDYTGFYARSSVVYAGNQFINNTGVIQQACQRNATLFLSSQFLYASDTPTVGNVDGSYDDPYADSVDNTLADVTMKYYTTNLGSGFATGKVAVPKACSDTTPDPRLDCNSNLHMNFYSLTLDATGFLYNADAMPPQDPYSSTPDWDWSHGLSSTVDGHPTYSRDVDEIWHATINGRGDLLNAKSADEVRNKVAQVMSSIAALEASASAGAANSTSLSTDTLVYQAGFDTKDWSGHLRAFPVKSDGTLDLSVWDAAEKIPAVADRKVFSYNPAKTLCADGTDGTAIDSAGVAFDWDNLDCDQQKALNTPNKTGTEDIGRSRVAYLLGNQSMENDGTITATTTKPFRKRTDLLGDIVDSDPWYVAAPNFAYDRLPSSDGGDTYQSTRGVSGGWADSSSSAYRTPMIYVGGNDGMLHAFNATKDGGNEVFAYVPAAVYGNLGRYTAPDYTVSGNHRFFVDGSPRAADAYFDDAWHTVLVGTTGAGSQTIPDPDHPDDPSKTVEIPAGGVFALDVTDPGSFDATKVLWEINPTLAQVSTGPITTTSEVPLADDSSGTLKVYGYANYLGYTFSQASIVPLKKNHTSTTDPTVQWAAVIGNGYQSKNQMAVLYILDLQTGELIRSILADDSAALDEDTTPTTYPNGLSTPLAVDVDDDRITDYIYAGDLHGNLWKFDVRDPDSANWDVAYHDTSSNPLPLFVACAATDTTCKNADRRPITAKPAVGSVRADQSGGLMLYFGTGQYYLSNDNSVPTDTADRKMYSIYGLWDRNTGDKDKDRITDRNTLVGQTIDAETTKGDFELRVTSKNTVAYTSKYGWYMDLRPSSTIREEERVVSTAAVLNGRVVFTTLIPAASNDVCTTGDSGWLMELDAYSGARPDPKSPLWDITGDGKINSHDLVTYGTGAGATDVPPTGRKSNVGPTKTPVILNGSELDYKITAGTAGKSESIAESKPLQTGRWSWRQLR